MVKEKRKKCLGRIFNCTVCQKSFKRQEHLSRHIRTHTGERPFHCPRDGCLKKFSRRDELIRHLRKKHSEPKPILTKKDLFHMINGKDVTFDGPVDNRDQRRKQNKKNSDPSDELGSATRDSTISSPSLSSSNQESYDNHDNNVVVAPASADQTNGLLVDTSIDFGVHFDAYGSTPTSPSYHQQLHHHHVSEYHYYPNPYHQDYPSPPAQSPTADPFGQAVGSTPTTADPFSQTVCSTSTTPTTSAPSESLPSTPVNLYPIDCNSNNNDNTPSPPGKDEVSGYYYDQQQNAVLSPPPPPPNQASYYDLPASQSVVGLPPYTSHAAALRTNWCWQSAFAAGTPSTSSFQPNLVSVAPLDQHYNVSAYDISGFIIPE